jgi:serine/threonine-protein kinase
MCLLRLAFTGGDGPEEACRAPEHAATEGGAEGMGCALKAGLERAVHGVLSTLAETIGPVPRVLLRDTDRGMEGPVVRPGSPEVADGPGHYQLLGEIARGGMGAVLKGRDPDLGRDVAVKILLEQHRDKPEMVRRFVEEAQIGGQLQHPGVVPIYELGTMADRRPFFSMKLVKGHTLAQLLDQRGDPAVELPRFLSIFESVCQTMAYAHSRGVIHRDLKPSNVMVGSFGEVQVMDWGLAKVLPRGGVVDDATAGKTREATVIATARSGDDSDLDLSRAGSVMGTPCYMAPEQARGEVDLVDERADVFALGSILCEILTGDPAVTGRNSGEIQRKAARGDLAEARARLDGCGADAELVAMAKDCLASEREDRPRDANTVTGRTTAYLAGVQERIKTAERERAVAEAKTVEERKRRRLQLGLAGCVLALTIVGGLGTTYVLQERTARAAALDRRFAEASALLTQAREDPENAAAWQKALDAIQQAARDATGRDAGLLDPKATRARLEALVAEGQAGLNAAVADRTLLDELAELNNATFEGDFSTDDRRYSAAFRARGFDLDGPNSEAVGRAIASRPTEVALALAEALDRWKQRRLVRGDLDGAARLTAVAKVADPDPWRNQLRDVVAGSDRASWKEPLRRLAREAPEGGAGLPPTTAASLGGALVNAGDPELAEAVLRRARDRNPGHLMLNNNLAWALEIRGKLEESLRYHTVVQSIHPASAMPLAAMLLRNGESERAMEVLRDLAHRRPNNPRYLDYLGTILKRLGREQESAEVFEKATTLARAQIRAQPGNGDAHANLAYVLLHKGSNEEAVFEYGEAARLLPGWGLLVNNRGIALGKMGRRDEALNAYREAARVAPRNEAPCFNAAHIYGEIGNWEEAAKWYREAIRRSPLFREAYRELGYVLRRQGRFAESLDAYEHGHLPGGVEFDFMAPPPPSSDLERARLLVAVEGRLPALIRGESQPADNPARLAAAEACYVKGLHAASTRFYIDAFNREPAVADARSPQDRYAAACAAVLAASGHGKDDPPPDDATKARLRAQALDWLRADRAAWAKSLDADYKTRWRVGEVLDHWEADPDLAGVRDPEALAKLSEAERKGWELLWADVRALLERAR